VIFSQLSGNLSGKNFSSLDVMSRLMVRRTNEILNITTALLATAEVSNPKSISKAFV
jgi:hypothetical protein